MSEPRGPWIQTGAGIAFDLYAPTRFMVDFNVDIAEALARLPRFTGHIRSGPYSVAQHSVLGADALHRETGRADIAAAFLLHDAHEAFIGDRVTPYSLALAGYVGACAASHPVMREKLDPKAAYSIGRDIAASGMKAIKAAIDAAIYEAAGIAWPLPADVQTAVKEMDLRMLATERRHLLGPSPAPWQASVETAKPVRLTGKMTVWPWPDAADAFRERLTRYIPNFQSPPARRAAGACPTRVKISPRGSTAA